jgi:hypothetical protein
MNKHSNIQSVLFNKYYFTENEAKKWLNKYHEYPIKDVHETKHYYRYRLREPNNFKYFRIINSHDPNVKFVIGFY